MDKRGKEIMIKWKEMVSGGILAFVLSALVALGFLGFLGLFAGVLMLAVNWFCELFAIGFVLSFAQSCGCVFLVLVLKALFSNNEVKVKID